MRVRCVENVRWTLLSAALSNAVSCLVLSLETLGEPWQLAARDAIGILHVLAVATTCALAITDRHVVVARIRHPDGAGISSVSWIAIAIGYVAGFAPWLPVFLA